MHMERAARSVEHQPMIGLPSAIFSRLRNEKKRGGSSPVYEFRCELSTGTDDPFLSSLRTILSPPSPPPKIASRDLWWRGEEVRVGNNIETKSRINLRCLVARHSDYLG